MAQQNIDFGTFPDDPNADAIRTAFRKVQENFTDLYSGLQEQAVLSVNKTQGAGITVNSPTGNVVVTANIAYVRVHSSTLWVGRDGNGFPTGSFDANITSSSQTLYVDLPSNITGVTGASFSGNVIANNITANTNINTANLTATANLSAGNISTGGNANVTGNLNVTANANITANLNANNGSIGNILTVGANANITGNLNVTANANITANLKSGNANLGNLATANFFQGDGGLLTNVSPILSPSIANGTSNVNIATSGGNVAIAVSGAIKANFTSTGVNVTGTGNFSGNLSAANLIGPLANGNSNISITSNANITFYVAGNATARMVTTSTGVNVAGTLNATGNANVGNIGATNANITAMTATGNVTVGNLIGPHSNGNSNVNIPSANGNVNISAVGNANIVVITGTGANITGTLNVTGNANVGNIGATNANVTAITATGNANVGNLGTAQVLATANVTAPQLISNIATGTAPFVVTSTTQVANLNAETSGLATYATTANSVAGANVSGQVNYAAVANSVAGANVSGQVNYAAVANSVDGANVSGAVAFATTANSVAGANVSGTVSSATTAGTVTTNAQPNITSVGTLTSLGVSGNITAANITANTGIFAGNGSGLTALSASNISTGTLAQARLANSSLTVNGTSISLGGTATITANTTQTLSNGAYITGDVFNGGTARTWAVDATTTNTANKVVARDTDGSFSANVITATLSGSATSAASATTAGTVTTNAQPNITSVGTLSSLSVTGNTTSGNFLGRLANGNSNVNIPATNGNVNISAAGNANILVVTGTGANITGTLNTGSGVITGNGSGLTALNGANVTGTVANATTATTAGTVTTNAQPNITSVGTLSALAVTANITSGNANLGNLARANFFQGDGGLLSNLSVSAGTSIINGNSNVVVDANNSIRISSTGNANIVVVDGTGIFVTGIANVSGNTTVGNLGATTVSATNIIGNITTAAQPNITSLGTLTGVTINGISNLGPNGNVIITGGAANAFLMTNGSGNLSWNTATLVPAQGSNTQVIFNDGGSNYAGNANLTFNKTNGNLSVGGNLNVTNNIVLTTSNITGVNVLSATTLTGTLSAGPQTGINAIGTLTALTVTGTAAANNFNSTNFANAKYVWANTGTLTSNIHSIVALQTWNNSSVQFSAIEANITDTASAANSLLIDLQISNASRFAVSKEGNVFFSGTITGNGSGLSAINGSNVSGAVLSATTAGTVTTNAQPNITSVGTLTSLAVNGTVTGTRLISNIAAGTAPLTVTSTTRVANLNVNYANVSDYSVLTEGITGTYYPTFVSGNAAANYILAANNAFTANLANGYLTANGFVGNGASLTSVNASSITSGTLAQVRLANSSLTVNGTSISLGSSGTITANTTQTLTLGSYLTGTSFNGGTAVTANVDATTAGTASKVVARDANANVYGNNFVGTTYTSNVATGTAPFVVTSTTQVANLNVATAGSAGTATTAGTVTTNAQPNITSVGTLSSLSVTSNITAGNANVTGQLISTVAIGTAPLVVTSTTRVSNLNVANAGFADAATNAFAVSANLSSSGINLVGTTLSANGNTSLSFTNGIYANTANNSITATTFVGTLSGPATTAGTVTVNAQPNITSVGTLSSLAITNGAATKLAVTSNAVPTADMVTITNAGNGVTTAGVNGINLTYVGGAAAVEASAYRTDFTPGATTGATWNGFRFVSSANTAAGVTMNAIKIDPVPGGAGAGTENAIYVGANWDNIVNYNGTSVIFGNGQVNAAQVIGTLPTPVTNAISNVGTVTVGTWNSTFTAGLNANTLANIQGSNVSGAVASATAATNASALLQNTSTATTVYPTFTTSSANGNSSAVINTGISANLGNASITATTFVGALSGAATSATTAGTVTTAAQPNITSVGTLSNLTVSGNITAQANVTMTGYVIRSVGTGISAAGTVQGTATVLTKEMNVVSTVASGAGVILPTAVAGMAITIINTSANSLLVYPHVGGDINNGATNAAFTQPSGATLQFVAPTTTDWYTVGATFA